MKLNILGNKIIITTGKQLNKLGTEAKRKKTLEKLERALKIMKNSRYKFSEYRLQKISKLSINTIKRYRKEINDIREKIDYI